VDTLLNPTLILEILSPTTEAYDRDEKFRHFRRLESVREYILVSQREPRIEQFVRSEPGDRWVFSEAVGLEAAIHLPCLGCELALADVYEDVEFPAGPPPRPSPNAPR
jgi:Uma2 family endonuclease